jgi:hypothetical protein
MLFQPTGDGVFYRACEADGYRGLVAAILDDPDYETVSVMERLVQRLRLAHDVALLIQLGGDLRIQVSDQHAADTINVASDERFIRSLHRLGYVSLEPARAEGEKRG